MTYTDYMPGPKTPHCTMHLADECDCPPRQQPKPLFDDADGAFLGWTPRACGEHRTVGPHRAWCFTCTEWCYPDYADACIRCRHPEG